MGTTQQPKPRRTNCSSRSVSSRSNWSGSKKDLGLSIEEKRRCIAPHPHLTLARQCGLLGLPRSTFYHQPAGESKANLRLMRRPDELYLELPYFGSRKFAVVLGRELRLLNDLQAVFATC